MPINSLHAALGELIKWKNDKRAVYSTLFVAGNVSAMLFMKGQLEEVSASRVVLRGCETSEFRLAGGTQLLELQHPFRDAVTALQRETSELLVPELFTFRLPEGHVLAIWSDTQIESS